MKILDFVASLFGCLVALVLSSVAGSYALRYYEAHGYISNNWLIGTVNAVLVGTVISTYFLLRAADLAREMDAALAFKKPKENR